MSDKEDNFFDDLDFLDDDEEMDPIPEFGSSGRQEAVHFVLMGEDGVSQKWSIKDGSGFLEEFGLKEEQVAMFVAVISSGDWVSAQCWEVVRRTYAITNAAEQGDADDYLPWDSKQLAKKMEVVEGVILQEIANAKHGWNRSQLMDSEGHMTGEITERVTTTEELAKQVDKATSRPDAEITKILEHYGFGEISEKHRPWLAERITELATFLGAAETREGTIGILQMEVSMRLYQGKLLKFDEKQIGGEEFRKVEKEYRALQDKVQIAALKLGVHSKDEREERNLAMDAISYMIKATQEYYGGEGRVLIDGMFTAPEADFLLTKTVTRPAMYPLDLVALVLEATRPENLWNPEWKPIGIEKEVQARILRLVQEFAVQGRDKIGEHLDRISVNAGEGEVLATVEIDSGDGFEEVAAPAAENPINPATVPVPIRNAGGDGVVARKRHRR